jgi:endo-1,4-beta-xylanase
MTRCFSVLCLALTLACGLAAADPYYQSLRDELGALGLNEIQFVYGDSEADVAGSFRPYGGKIGAASVETLDVSADGVPFSHARRVAVTQPGGKYWEVIIGGDNHGVSARKGDALWCVFWLRAVNRSDAGDPRVLLTVKNKDKGIHTHNGQIPSYEWRRFAVPVGFKSVSGSEWKTEFYFNYGIQTVDIGGLAFVKVPGAKLGDFPTTVIDVDYAGRALDAPWRAAAAERIDELRKGDLTVEVVDAAGKPVPDAEVAVRMQRHAFRFGNISNTSVTSKDDAVGRKNREVFLENFNHATIGTFKHPAWAGKWKPEHAKDATIKVIDWLESENISMHGHTLCWHDRHHAQVDLNEMSVAQVREHMLKYVRDVLTDPKVAGRVESWDAINHPLGFTEVWEYAGKDIMLEELKLHRELAPEALLFVNEGQQMPRGGEGATGPFGQMIRYYMENGAPIDGVGFMCHFNAQTLTAPEELLAKLDGFAALAEDYDGYDLQLKITEFDISVNDKDPAQVSARADYVRDFLTMCFSHPKMQGITAWGFWAGRAWKPEAMYFNKDWSLREHGEQFRKLVFGDWWTEEGLTTNAKGQAQLRGFLGDYTVTARKQGQEVSVTGALSKDGSTLRITLP